MPWPDETNLSVEGKRHLRLIRSHVDVAADMLKAFFEAEGGFMLQAHLLVEPKQLPPSDPSDDSKIGVLVLQAASVSEPMKDRFCDAIRMACNEMRIFAVFYLSEAWMKVVEKGAPLPHGPVASMPDKVEVCVVDGTFMVGCDTYAARAFAEVDRSSGPKPVLKPWNKECCQVSGAGGRMTSHLRHLTPLV